MLVRLSCREKGRQLCEKKFTLQIKLSHGVINIKDIQGSEYLFNQPFADSPGKSFKMTATFMAELPGGHIFKLYKPLRALIWYY